MMDRSFTHPGRVDWQLACAEIVPHLEPFASFVTAEWETRRAAAVAPMKEEVNARIYEVLPNAVKPLLHPPLSDWPFKVGVRKAEWLVPDIENLTGALPLSLAFQRFVEATGHVPSWTESVNWFSSESQSQFFMGPVWNLYHGLAEERRPPKTRWQKGIVWRIGNAYMSFLREMDFLSRMIHDHGIPLRMHVMVDAVLKTDFWFDRHAVCIFIPNEMRGRKQSPVASTGIVHNVPIGNGTSSITENGITRRYDWNEIKQAPEQTLSELAAAIREDRAIETA